ncbi:primosomal protein N' (replication factor Y) - superfamily II helicase [Aliiroseovarius crassostreae]|uniref:primosomal protein N' (replication factor Y) - superfamily II helicase n=1 Tax=Aliiroseovarius crassostreae TaxID=154981 RepID=UPI003C7C294C
MSYPPEDVPKAPLDEHRFPCDQCGADLRFNPDRGGLTCDHCGNQIPMQESSPPQAITEMDYQAALSRSLPDAETEVTRATSCTNCAAVFEFDPQIHAAECPFCATPVVADTGTQRQIKPKGVAPFVLSEQAARDAMTHWLGRLWFAPNGLQDYARKGRRLHGIYVPYWTYDADTRTAYSGQRGDDYYVERTVMVDGKRQTRRQRKTRWSARSGRVARFFDDVLVLASRGLPKRYTDALAPWDLSRLEPYSPEYLAGFQAEGYTVELPDGFAEARDHMDRVILRDVKFDIGGDRQRVTSLDTKLSDVTFKHILLPVWLAAYKYRGKTYRFVVNGQSGRVQGERPYSAVKITIAVILGLIVAGVLGYVVAQNQ